MKTSKKELLKKLTMILLSFILCISFVVPVFALYTTVQPKGFQQLSKDEYFGRNALSKLKNGEKYVAAYDRIVEAIKNLEPAVSLLDLGLTVNEFKGIRETVMGDPIDDFWLGPEVEISYSHFTNIDLVITANMRYFSDIKNDLENKKKLYDASLQKFIDSLDITPGMSESEIVLEVHNKLAMQITYTNDDNYHIDNDFGSIVEGFAECDGYATAFTNILALYGIQSFAVSGIMNNGEGHAWNIIRIDGEYYQCDPTWNDYDKSNGDSEIFYYKYNITSEEMLSDRSYRPYYLFDLPNCTATAANYYTSHPEICLSTSSPLEAFAALEKDGLICVYVEENGQTFKSWFSANIDELCELCGYDTSEDIKKNYQRRGNECHIYISGPRIDETEKIPGDKNNDGLISYNEFYGRCSLAASPDRAKLLKAYDRIYNGVAALESNVDLSDLKLTREQYRQVFYAYRGDPTGHFWLDEVNCDSYYFTQSQLISRMTPAYYEELTSDLDAAKARYNDEINSFIAGLDIGENASDYDITLAVHNALAMKASIYNSDKTHSPYYLMTENIGRCQAYCHAYTELLANFGISAFTIYGEMYKDSDYSYYRHSWVLNCVDGTYCYTDVCCDDKTLSGADANENDIYYTFFNVDAEALYIVHRPHSYYPYTLPENISDEMGYFKRHPELYVNIYSPYSVYAAAEKDGFIRLQYNTANGEDYSWLEVAFLDIDKEIANACGYIVLPKTPLNYTCLYGEYHIYIEGLTKETAPDKGDIDGDSKICAVDSNLAKRLIAGTSMADYIMKYACDIDSDEALTSIDSNLLRRMIAGN